MLSTAINKDTARFLLTVEEIREAVIAGGIIPLSEVPHDDVGNLDTTIDGVVYDDSNVLSDNGDGSKLYPAILLGQFREPGEKYTWTGDRKNEPHPNGFTVLVNVFNDEHTTDLSVEIRTGTLESALIDDNNEVCVIIDENGRLQDL